MILRLLEIIIFYDIILIELMNPISWKKRILIVL